MPAVAPVTMAILLVRSIPGGRGSTLGCMRGILRSKNDLKLLREYVGLVVEEKALSLGHSSLFGLCGASYINISSPPQSQLQRCVNLYYKSIVSTVHYY